MFVTSKIFKKAIHHPPSADAHEEGVFSPKSDKNNKNEHVIITLSFYLSMLLSLHWEETKIEKNI